MLLLPRDYQTEAVQSLYSYFTAHTGNPLVAMPTGTGKSVVIAMFLESIFKFFPNQRVLVLTHVKELIAQNYSKLLELWSDAPAGIYSAGLKKRDLSKRVTFAGIASIVKQAALLAHIDLVLIDEAHLVSPDDETMYQDLLRVLKARNPLLKVIGFTATPWRLKQGSLTDGGIFTDICFDITGIEAFNRLIAEGYLSPPIPKKTKTVLDIDGVHIRGGEFNANELQVAVDRDEITERAIKEAMEVGFDRRHWLVFAAGVEHSNHIAAMLNSFGISAVSIHSKLTSDERDAAIAGFKSGKYQAAVNNNVLTTGFDFPAIDLILMLRPTMSPILWVQMLGRGTRPLYAPGYDLSTVAGRLAAIAASAKQNCMVLDFAGNTKRLGPINDPVVPRKRGQKTGEAPVKECPVCSTWNHASVRHCVCCGNEFHFQTKLQHEASTDELIKGELPITETFKVDHITYAQHNKLGTQPSMKVTYYCGYKMFQEFVCLQHDIPGIRAKANRWWRQRSSDQAPPTVEAALELSEKLNAPTHIRVWINKKYPDILAYCYDGSAFGACEAGTVAKPEVQAAKPKPAEPELATLPPAPADAYFDDDIPF